MAATYLDSSAIVKLAVREPESDALRKHLRRRRPLVSSGLARTEVLRALLPGGETSSGGRAPSSRPNRPRARQRPGLESRRVSSAGGTSVSGRHPSGHARRLGTDLGEIVTYDERMVTAARTMGYKVAAPT